MPLFALPLANKTQTSSTTHHVHFASLSLRQSTAPSSLKRKRDSSPSDNETTDHEPSAAITNPLSLTPAEVIQYRLAGLELDRQLPDVKGWPHRGVPDSVGSAGKARRVIGVDGDEDEDDDDEIDEKTRRAKARREREERKTGKSKLRIQHMGVLVAIMMRCLEQGDIPRAARAWGLLLRVQVVGKGVDLRGSGLWGVGAEVLIRGGEYNVHSAEDETGDDYWATRENGQDGIEKRWGTKDSLLRAKDYYERLILQYPYKRQFHNTSTTALDFWPAMLGCEIYGIQYEWKTGLQKLAAEAEQDEKGSLSGSDMSDSEREEADDDETGGYEARQDRLRKRRAEKRWEKKDDVRKRALVASEQVAARMDDLMTTPPYSDSAELMRLRAMLALFVGDLCVPEKWNEEWAGGGVNSRLRSQEAEKRFLGRQREADMRRGKERRKEEKARAKKLLERIGIGNYDVGRDSDEEGYDGEVEDAGEDE
ncbi:Transcription initiation factor Rrn11 protein [Rutstroemia sp. NJR-2017a WRK4]|nr:Transcription initiation factor Rrn11 protein [Rutstroemia sp. NJR-2017a WRK4]